MHSIMEKYSQLPKLGEFTKNELCSLIVYFICYLHYFNFTKEIMQIINTIFSECHFRSAILHIAGSFRMLGLIISL